MNFLNTHPDLPIVAHNVEHDRDQVLRPAFERVGAIHNLPKEERWRCTFEMSMRYKEIKHKSIEGVLEHFGLPGRDPEAKHDAVEDCRFAAAVYMKLMVMPPPKVSVLGFVKE